VPYRFIAATRFIVILPAVTIFVGATVLLVYDTIVTANEILAIATHAPDLHSAKAVGFELIETVDLFLMSIVLYIISIGLFQLFIADLDLPNVLRITTFEELKEKLAGVIVVVLGVFFLGELAEISLSADVTPDLLVLSVSLAAMILALTFFLWQQGVRQREFRRAGRREHPPTADQNSDQIPNGR
jgi:uncharacterized membrane protein YqhA